MADATSDTTEAQEAQPPKTAGQDDGRASTAITPNGDGAVIATPLISPKTGLPLCPEWEKRAAMGEGDFWNYVLLGVEPGELPYDLLPGWEPWVEDETDIAQPCATCGGTDACGYDEQGRPYIHVEESRHA